MALTPRGASILAGGSFGAYTSNFQDDPIAGTLSTAVGAGVGAFMRLPTLDLQELSKVVVGSKIDLNTINSRSMPQFEEDFLTRFNEQRQYIVDTPIRQKERLDKVWDIYQERLNEAEDSKAIARAHKNYNKAYSRTLKINNVETGNIQKNLSNISDILDTHGLFASKDPTQVLEQLSNLKNINVLKQVSPLLSTSELKVINSGSLELPSFANKLKVFEKKDQLKKLTNHFINEMGNSPTEAAKKAQIFVNRAAGTPITVINGNLSLTDSISGKNFTIPLTSYTDKGIKFHNAGNGTAMAVKNFNPYARDYIRGDTVNIDGVMRKVTAQDMLKGESPEMMLRYLNDDAPITSDLISRMKSLMHYDSEETGTKSFMNPINNKFEPSQDFIAKNNMVDIGSTFKRNLDGSINPQTFSDIKTMSNNGYLTEYDKFFTNMANELDGFEAAHLGDNVSLNKLTAYNTVGYNTLAPFGPGTRNDSGVGNRSTRIVNPTEDIQAIKKLMGSDFEKQFSSSQVLNKLDISDMEKFNQLSAKIFDSNHVLGDGSGLFNLSHSDKLTIQEAGTLNLGRNPIIKPILNDYVNETGAFDSNQKMLNTLEGNSNANKLNIGNQVIAYDSDGKPIKINKAFNEANIVGKFRDSKGNLILQTENIFNPALEKSAKLFGVGSKVLVSGVNENQFKVQVGIGLLLNEGTNLDKMSKSKLIKTALARAEKLKTLPTVIMSAKDSGMEGIQSILKESNSADIRKLLADNLKLNPEHSGFDYMMETTNRNPRIAALTAYMLSNNKAATDLVTQTGATLSETSIREFRDSAFNSSSLLDPKLRQKALDSAYRLVEESGITDSVTIGQTKAIVAVNKGRSIVGAGNTTKMSWTAKANLLMSGFTKEDLSLFGHTNQEALYELNSILQGNNRKSVNPYIKGKEAEFLQLLQQDPERRAEVFENTFGKSVKDSPYLTYKMQYEKDKTKEINFSRLSTNRSGNYTDNGFKLIKELDGHKASVVAADMDYAAETNKVLKREKEEILKRRLESYNSHVSSMTDGKNNIVKAATSLQTPLSQIMEVKSIGGQAEEYVASLSKTAGKPYSSNVMFISQEAAFEKAEKMGVKLIEDPNGSKITSKFDRLKRMGYSDDNGKFVPLAELVTREPAQGPASSEYVEYMIDTSIKRGHKDNIFITGNNSLYSYMMSGDMDQDIVQTVGSRIKDVKVYEDLHKKREVIRSVIAEETDLIKDMRVKGKAKPIPTLGQFLVDSPTISSAFKKFGEFKVAEFKQARNRKTLSAPATTLAVSMSKALEMEFKGDTARLTKGRIGTYLLVENLIKSAHMDTEDFLKGTMQPIEAISSARNTFLKGGSSSEYKAVLQEHLPAFLNKDAMNSPEKINKLDDIVNDMITSEINHAKTINKNPSSPLDVNIHRNSESFSDVLKAVIQNDGVIEPDFESGMLHMRKASGQLYNGFDNAIVNTLKNNKGLLMGGVAGLGAISILGRSEPTYADNQRGNMPHSSKGMLQNTPVGIDTNPTKAAYITPTDHSTGKSIRIAGDFRRQIDNENYNSKAPQMTSLLLPSENNSQSISNAIFGNGIRSARLESNN